MSSVVSVDPLDCSKIDSSDLAVIIFTDPGLGSKTDKSGHTMNDLHEYVRGNAGSKQSHLILMHVQ